MKQPDAIVVGAGIAGLAMARALSVRGYRVTVIERDQRAVGASVRNFGMVWPIGQPEGELYDAALRSREIWNDCCRKAGLFQDPVGSLHLAYRDDEAQVLEELARHYGPARELELVSPERIAALSPAVVTEGLVCGLYSKTELIVDPREAIAGLPRLLEEAHGVRFQWGEAVSSISGSKLITARGEYGADVIMICNGAEINAFFPEVFQKHEAVRCKLQMMRLAPQPEGWRIGPALCGALSLIHYQGFRVADSLNALRERFMETMPEYLEWGIHVMVSQNGRGELTVGDSHEYGATLDPFDKNFVNELILDYLSSFTRFRRNDIIETWNGTYTKLKNGEPYFFENPSPGVFLFNGLGGAGMTLSFGLAEKLVATI